MISVPERVFIWTIFPQLMNVDILGNVMVGWGIEIVENAIEPESRDPNNANKMLWIRYTLQANIPSLAILTRSPERQGIVSSQHV